MYYEDFVIQVTEGVAGSFRTTVLASPAGQASGSFVVPADPAAAFATADRAPVRAARGAPPELLRHLVPEEALPDEMPSDRRRSNRNVGEALFRSLFSGQVRSLYDQSLGGLRNQPDHGLRIKLKFDSSSPAVAKLQGLPWELMRRAETAEYLGLSRLSPVVRFLDVPRPPTALPFRPPLRILVLIASPDSLESLDLAKEQEQIEKAWGGQSTVEVSFVDRAEPEALRRALLDRDVHVLHFMGHGGFEEATGEGVLYFVDGRGGALPVRGSTLTTKLRDIRSLRLVVLNACETARVGAAGDSPFAGVASALVRGGMPAVVAMRKRISDVAALAFSEAFYTRLAGGDPIDAALTEGRQAIHSATPDSVEWSTPILYLRVADGVLFRAPGPVPTAEGLDTTSVRLPIQGMPGEAAAGTGGTGAFEPATGQSGPIAHGPVAYGQATAGSFDETLAKVGASDADTAQGRRKRSMLVASLVVIALLGWPTIDRWPWPGKPVDTVATGSKRAGDLAAGRKPASPVPKGERVTDRAADRRRPTPPSSRAVTPPPATTVVPEPTTPNAAAGVAGPTEHGPRVPFPGGDSVLPQSMPFETSVPGLHGQLRDVVLLEDGRLGWLLAVHNEGTGRPVGLGLDLSRTYLADTNGYRYAVERADAGAVDSQVDDVLAAGDSQVYWLVFGAPLGRATSFIAFFNTPDDAEASFLPFRVPLQARAASRARPEPVIPAPKGAVRVEVAVQQLATRGASGVEARVAAVHLVPADPAAGRANNRIRWSVALLNSTYETETAGLALPAVYLEDELGNYYPVMASSAGKRPYQGRYLEQMEGGLRQDVWLEFNAPRTGVQAMNVRLAGYDPKAFDVDSFKVDLPKIDPRFRYDPKVLPIRSDPSAALGPSLAGLEGRLVEVERLSNGRLRWQIELRNESASTLDVGFDFEQVRLSDGKRSYELLESDTGLPPEDVYAERLAPGSRVFHWLDFAEPSQSAREFHLNLVSHDGSFSYGLLRVEVDLQAFLAKGE